MWKSIIISILFLISPFLISGPDEDVTSYILTNNGKLIGQIEAQKDGSLKYDISKIKEGEHYMTVMPCGAYRCGDEAVEVIITRPGPPSKVTNIGTKPCLGDPPDFPYVEKSRRLNYYDFLEPPPRKEKQSGN